MTATTDAPDQRRRHRHAVRDHSTPSRPSRSWPASSSGPPTAGSAAPTTAAASRVSTAPARSTCTSGRPPFDADHPAVLVGSDNGPTPAELPAARARRLPDQRAGQHRRRARHRRSTRSPRPSRATSTCSASSASTPDVRNGYEGIRVVFHVKGDAEAEQLAALVEQSHGRSAVYDVVTNGVPVVVDVATA